VRHEKEKESVDQKNPLEFLLVGIRESTQFGEVLVTEGSESEIMASQRDVVSRLTSLGQEKVKSQMESASDSTIAFEGDAGGLRQVGEAIEGFGIVVSKFISAEKSSVEGQPSGSVCINQVVSFKVVVVDKKGNWVTSSPKGKGIIPFVVEITLDGKQELMVNIEENQGQEGEFSVSFTPTTAGQYQISVSRQGKHFKGSPFRIDVVERLKGPFHRDYNAVGTKSVLVLGSAGKDQFSNPRVACNSRGDIVVVDCGKMRVQVFDKAGKFRFKFGFYGNGNGQFVSPHGVAVDQRNDQIVVADTGDDRIQDFDEKGGFIRAFGSSGSGDGQIASLLMSWLIHWGHTLLLIVIIIVCLSSTQIASS